MLLLNAVAYMSHSCDTVIKYYHNEADTPTSPPMNDTDFRLACLNLCIDQMSDGTYGQNNCIDFCRGK